MGDAVNTGGGDDARDVNGLDSAVLFCLLCDTAASMSMGAIASPALPMTVAERVTTVTAV